MTEVIRQEEVRSQGSEMTEVICHWSLDRSWEWGVGSWELVIVF